MSRTCMIFSLARRRKALWHRDRLAATGPATPARAARWPVIMTVWGSVTTQHRNRGTRHIHLGDAARPTYRSREELACSTASPNRAAHRASRIAIRSAHDGDEGEGNFLLTSSLRISALVRRGQ